MNDASLMSPHGHEESMTLLDWFAGLALQGLIASNDVPSWSSQELARWSYDMGEEMLHQRSQRKAQDSTR